jgi:hypothetical protein
VAPAGLEVQDAADLNSTVLLNKKPPEGGFLFTLNLLNWSNISFRSLTRNCWGIKLKLNFAVSINVDIHMTALRQLAE